MKRRYTLLQRVGSDSRSVIAASAADAALQVLRKLGVVSPEQSWVWRVRVDATGEVVIVETAPYLASARLVTPPE